MLNTPNFNYKCFNSYFIWRFDTFNRYIEPFTERNLKSKKAYVSKGNFNPKTFKKLFQNQIFF